MVITLIGYRGSGKSTVAPLLARTLGCDWIDADLVIEERAGCTIREIFAQEGEPGFRARERDVIRELLARESLVLAAGGGAILNPETRSRMRAAGPVVWLKAPIEILAARIAGDGATADRRPNLAGGGIDEIRRMLTLREPLYRECATLEFDVGERTPADVAHEILLHFNRQTPGESA
ncbi:MAG: shikimate kinase [Planctomycetota bacterium]|nr:shikimate kinase [Planctomycetota bacterium]